MPMLIRNLRFKEKIFDVSLFRKLFLISLSLEMIAFLDIPALVFKCFVLSWGLAILIKNFFIEKRAFKVKYKYILWAFLSLMTVTSLVHISIYFVPNIVLILYTAVCFFMFYGMYTAGAHEDIEKEMVFVLKFFIYFGTICGILSLLILFWRRGATVGTYHLGIFKNRLIGIYTNSNILAFSMIESIVACDIISTPYIKNKFKDIKLNNWILIGCVVINCICLFLSDSNASFLFLIIYATMRVFCNMFFKNGPFGKLKFFKSVLIVVGFCVVFMSASFSVRDMCQNFIEKAMSDMYSNGKTLNADDDSYFNAKNIIMITPDSEKDFDSFKDSDSSKIHIGREHYEVSSGRITLWKQGVKIFKHNPIIGIGRANLKIYSKEYLNGGLIHPDLHNGYLTILVCYGAIGLLIFGIFSFLVALDVCKNMFLCVNKNYFGVNARLFSVLVAYCGYCLFEKAILFDMTFMVGFFWVILGYAVSFINKFQNEKTTGNIC